MGQGKRNLEADSREDCSTPFTNKDNEKAAYYDKHGTWQKLWSIKVHLIPVLAVIIALLAIIVVVAVSRSGESAKCMDDWLYYKCKGYYFSKEEATWNNSQKFCQSHNSSLAIIDNEEELNFLNAFKGPKNYWIGLSRVNKNFSWFWTNDTLYKERIFNITSLETEDGVLEHAFLNHTGVKSEHGRQIKMWICNKKLPYCQMYIPC